MDREQLKAREGMRRAIAARLRAFYRHLAALPAERLLRLLRERQLVGAEGRQGGAGQDRDRGPTR
jgi:hypothetical protein